MKKNLRLLLMLLLCQALYANAQDIPAKIKQAKWVKIMSTDSLYNYFEAQAEFEKFYSGYLKEKLKEERSRMKGTPASQQEEHLENPVELLVSEYRKWTMMIEPFVRANGTIMPLSERLAIIHDTRNKQQAGQ